MNEFNSLTRSAGFIGLLTLLSRVLGMVRDIVITYLFGAAMMTDAFWVAFRIPNLLRRLFAEGALTVSFIPVFTDRLENQDKNRAKEISDSVFTLLSITLIILCLLGVVFSPYIVKLFASGFDDSSFNLTVLLNRIMFPYIIFISLTALCMGILNSLRHFFAPSFSPVLFNVCMIIVAVFFHTSFNIPIIALAIGVLTGGILQFLFQIPFLRARNFMFRPKLNLYSPDVRRVLLLMIPQLFGLAVYNINIIVNTQYASYLPSGTVSYLFLSERLIEFPLGIIAVSLGTVLLPSLSSYISRGETRKFAETYINTLKLLLYIMVPCTFGLIFLSKPICNMIYQRGEFGLYEMIYTSESLVGYAAGLWAVGAIRITVPVFFANKDTKTPVKAAFCAFIVNALLGYILCFVFNFKHTGLAVASSVSSVVYFILLLILLHIRVVNIQFKELLMFLIRLSFIGFIMGIVVKKGSELANWDDSQLSLYKFVIFVCLIVLGTAVYYFLSKIMRVQEAGKIVGIIRNR